jgi:hypothetical protein
MNAPGEKDYAETTMAATLGAPSIASPITISRKRRRLSRNGLLWAVILMVLLNVLVWGGMIAVTWGLIAFDGQVGVRLIPQ